ncbi:MAG: GatB/YqeY domain-containing protein [Actinobacteria bacterium]|nr:GatB/YqeY domain-containing protein [Actinomycetota bacterium]
MTEMKQRLQSDLTESIRSRDEVRSATLRMALSAITNEEVSGKQARILTDDEVITVLGREAKKRRESVEAYTAANRPELADRESAELAVLANYLPEALSEEELAGLIAAAVDAARAQGHEGMKAMGVVMKQLQPQITGRADGAAVAAAVKAALGA